MEEGLLELEEPGFAGTTQSQSDWLAAQQLLRTFLALLPGSQLDLDPFEEDVGRTGPGMSWYAPSEQASPHTCGWQGAGSTTAPGMEQDTRDSPFLLVPNSQPGLLVPTGERQEGPVSIQGIR